MIITFHKTSGNPDTATSRLITFSANETSVPEIMIQ